MSVIGTQTNMNENCNNFGLGIHCDCPRCKDEQVKLEREFEGEGPDLVDQYRVRVSDHGTGKRSVIVYDSDGKVHFEKYD